MPAIGPTFAAELRAAGVNLDGLAWNVETGVVTFSDDVSDSVRYAVADVLALHVPTKPMKSATTTLADFKARLTTAEKAKIADLISAASQLGEGDRAVLFDFITAQTLDYGDDKFKYGIRRLTELGVLTTERAQELSVP